MIIIASIIFAIKMAKHNLNDILSKTFFFVFYKYIICSYQYKNNEVTLLQYNALENAFEIFLRK